MPVPGAHGPATLTSTLTLQTSESPDEEGHDLLSLLRPVILSPGCTRESPGVGPGLHTHTHVLTFPLVSF